MVAEISSFQQGPTPFPWSNGRGLANVLRNPLLWAGIFKGDDRHAIKRAVRKKGAVMNSRVPTVIRIEDDQLIGSFVVELLASCEGREQLKKEFRILLKHEKTVWSDFLANRLFSSVREKKGVPDPEEVCVERRPSYLCIRPEKFSRWLAKTPREHVDDSTLALYACSFAILQPEDASDLYAILVGYGAERYSILLGDRTIEEEEARSKPSREVLETDQNEVSTPQIPATEDSQEPVGPAKRTSWTHYEEASHFTKSLGEHWQSWSLNQLSEFVSLVAEVQRVGRELLAEITDIQKTIDDCVSSINKSGWLECTVCVPDPRSNDNQTTISDLLGELRASESQVTALQGLTDQADTLAGRLGEHPSPCINTGNKSISHVIGEFESLNLKLRSRIEYAVQRDRAADSLLAEIMQRSSDTRHRVVQEVDVASWALVCSFLLGDGAVTDTTQKYAGLFGNHEILGAAIIHLWEKDSRRAKEFLCGEVLENESVPWQEKLRILSCLSAGRLEQLGQMSGEYVSEVAGVILAICLARGTFDDIEYVRPLLYCDEISPSCRKFYQGILEAKTNDIVVDIGDLHLSDETPRAADKVSRVDSHRRYLLEIIDEPVGTRGAYGRLRIIAKMSFLNPLETISKHDPHVEAIRRIPWKGIANGQKETNSQAVANDLACAG